MNESNHDKMPQMQHERPGDACTTPEMAETVVTSECETANSPVNKNEEQKTEARSNGKESDESQAHIKFITQPDSEKEHAKLLSESPEKATGKRKKRDYRGWVVVVASWVIMIPVAGTLSSFGVLVSSLSEEFNATKLETGWIASLAFGFTVGTCPLSTPLFTVFGGRKVATFGVLSGSVSLVATSFVSIIHIMFLTYSAMFGISANFIYNSGMSLTGQYFTKKHQALATCLASAGISFGTLLMNPFCEYLNGEVGWRNTFRIMAGMVFVVGLICVCAFKPVKTVEQKVVTKLRHTKQEDRNEVLERAIGSHRELDKQAITESLQNCNESKISIAAQEIKKSVFDKRMYDCSVCSDPTFILWMIGTLFWSLSFLFPLIFLIDYMISIGIDAASGALVMTAYGISEFVGRLICATVADRLPFGFAYVYGGSCALMGIATLLAPHGKSLEIMYVYGVAVGVNSGILNSLMYATTMQLFAFEKGRHVWGYINVMLALGMIVGPVQAGIIYDSTQSYEAAFYTGGGIFIIGSITMLLLPIVRRFFPPKEREAVGKREVPIVKRSGPRNSLRSALFSRDMAKRQTAPGKSKWKSGISTDLRELDELHEGLEPMQA